MLKTTNSEVTFAEIPDEITLCINISGCPNHCKGCHSKFLWENIGDPLYLSTLFKLINKNQGITCVCFMGGDAEPSYINTCAIAIKDLYDLKVAWYSGKEEIHSSIDLKFFDYIKIGPYIEEYGGLDNPNTNQKLFKVEHTKDGDLLINITYKFWKK